MGPRLFQGNQGEGDILQFGQNLSSHQDESVRHRDIRVCFIFCLQADLLTSSSVLESIETLLMEEILHHLGCIKPL